jgi:hypothetical protein
VGYLSILQFSITVIIFEATCFCLNILKLIIFTHFYILFDIKLLLFRNMTSNQLFQIWRDQQHYRPLSSKLNVYWKKLLIFVVENQLLTELFDNQERKFLTVMVNNSTNIKNINKTNNYLSPQISEHKK